MSEIVNNLKQPILIWEGVYKNFEEANIYSVGNGFSGEKWSENSTKVIIESLEMMRLKKTIPHFHKQRTIILVPIVCMLLDNLKTFKILDFGGGFGIGFLALKESLIMKNQLYEYYVVELPEVCEKAKSVFKKYLPEDLSNKRILFEHSIPERRKYDLVYSASAIQYISNWKSVLKDLVKSRPQLLLLSDLFAGSIPTFATLQNYYGSKIPHWFLNIEEVIHLMEELGYALKMNVSDFSRRLGVDGNLPMENFPSANQLGATCNLLFTKIYD
jgi:putative methyltransferase (TIGR04325 family)